MRKLLAVALIAMGIAGGVAVGSTLTAQTAHACDGGPCQCTGAGCNATP